MAAYEGIDRLMAENLQKIGRQPNSLEKLNYGKSRELLTNSRNVPQRPLLPGGMEIGRNIRPGYGGALLAALGLVPAAKEGIHAAMGLDAEGLEDSGQSWPHHEVGSSYESSYYRGEPSQVGRSPHPLPSSDFNEEDFLRDAFRTSDL